MKISESRLQSKVHLAAGSQPDMRLFRNNVGLGWVGTVVSQTPDRVVLANPRKTRFGLHPGSSDLIGWKTVEITPEMVGKKVAVFVGIEVKTDTGRIQPNQHQWMNTVNRFGGVAIVTRTPNIETIQALLNPHLP